jgi:hypothetical protein
MKLSTYQSTLPTLPADLVSDDYLVPAVVEHWGTLVGAQAEALANDQTESEWSDVVEARYAALAQHVAQLLTCHNVTELSEEAAASGKHRWATKIDPWIALGTRVDSVHQAYRNQTPEKVGPAAERLWVALDARCKALTGKTFKEVLGA